MIPIDPKKFFLNIGRFFTRTWTKSKITLRPKMTRQNKPREINSFCVNKNHEPVPEGREKHKINQINSMKRDSLFLFCFISLTNDSI